MHEELIAKIANAEDQIMQKITAQLGGIVTSNADDPILGQLS